MTESTTQTAPSGEIAVQPRSALTRTVKSLVELERGISHYPEDIRTPARWLQGFFLDHCDANVNSLRAIAAKLGDRFDKSPEYFRNVLHGDYFTSKTTTWKAGGQGWSEFLDLVAALRRYAQQAARAGQIPFIQTPTYQSIANFITGKRALSSVCRIGGIIAPTGGQTSESFKFYRALNNHGAVVHFEAPSSGGKSAFQLKLAEQYHAVTTRVQRVQTTREQTIRENVNETRCIIIDNCQVLYDKRRGNDQPCFNYLRELYDDKRPTIILKFTEEFLAEMIGAEAKGYFEQFIGRMGGLNSLLRLPPYAPLSDLRCIARAYKLAPSAVEDYLEKWSRQPGRIRIVFERLQLAQVFAKQDERDRITLADLAAANEYVPPPPADNESGSEVVA